MLCVQEPGATQFVFPGGSLPSRDSLAAEPTFSPTDKFAAMSRPRVDNPKGFAAAIAAFQAALVVLGTFW